MTREEAIDLAGRMARRHARVAFVYADQRGPGYAAVAGRSWAELLDWERAAVAAIVLPDGRVFVQFGDLDIRVPRES